MKKKAETNAQRTHVSKLKKMNSLLCSIEREFISDSSKSIACNFLISTNE